MQKKLNALALLFTLFIISACSDDDNESALRDADTAETETEEEEEEEAADTVPEVTYLLYMVGDSELNSYLTDNITDLKSGYLDTDINANLLIYTDLSDTPVLYQIKKDENDSVWQDTVKVYTDQYSTDPDVMAEVISEVFELYPAERRGITFSSHANGSFYTSNTPVKKRSFGSEGEEEYSMNITDMRQALDSCPHLDMIMFDACLMGNIETAYEMKENCDYFLATPNSVPGTGFPYDEILPSLLLMDEEGLSAAAEGYMEHYHSNNVKWDDFVAVSVTDVSCLENVAVYLDSLFQSADVQNRLFYLDRDNLQMFEEGYYLYDVGDWVDSLGTTSQYVEKIHEALEDAIVYEEHSDYASVSDYGDMLIPVDDARFCGLNTYVPPTNPFYEYTFITYFTMLKWYEDAGFWRASFYSWFERYQGMI